MDLREHFRQARESLAEHPRRVIASAMGVFWGTAAIILLTAAAAGFREYMQVEFARFGRGAAAVHPSITSSGFPGYRKGLRVELSRAAAREAERRNADVIEAILPEQISSLRILVEAGKNGRRLDLSASDARFPAYRNFSVEHGRFYDAHDVDAAAPVAVLGPEAAAELFGSAAEAVGRTIRVEGQGFDVIGVSRSKGRQYFNVYRPDNRLIMMPMTSAEERLGYRDDAVSRLLVYPRSGAGSASALEALRASLGPASGFHPGDIEALRVFDLTRFTRLTDLFYAGFMVFIGLAGTITLLVAAVGIANYQLAILSERSVELGVARALGARSSTLVLQTLCESLLVSGGAALLGAVLGLACLRALAELATTGALPAPIVAFPVVALALLSTAGVALVAATIPALRVRSVDVSVALREST